jgi:hypothetical protein
MSRNDAAFYTQYHDSDPVWFSEDKEIVIYRNGEMRIVYEDDKGEFHTLRYTSDLDDKGLDTDEKLAEANENGKIEWIHNPWFEVVYHDNEDGETFIDLPEAIEYAQKVAAEYAAHKEGVSGE